MTTPDRNISEDSIKTQAQVLGLAVDEAEFAGLADRLTAALRDIDRLDELNLSGHEPAVTFTPEPEDAD